MDPRPCIVTEEERRIRLQSELLEIAPKAWYKRPADNRMSYPCIIYRMSRPWTRRANDRLYAMIPCWNVIYISREPDDGITRRILERFQWCSFDREYENDGLYHYSFTLYY